MFYWLFESERVRKAEIQAEVSKQLKEISDKELPENIEAECYFCDAVVVGKKLGKNSYTINCESCDSSQTVSVNSGMHKTISWSSSVA